MARILLLGGTGAMGVYLAPELIKLGYEVDVTTRGSTTSDGTLRYVKGDARDIGFLKSICLSSRYDAIIDFMIYTTEEFRERRDILLGFTGHYLFLSSYRVFADTQGQPITERSPRLVDVCEDKEYLSTDEYALAKGRQEDLLRESRLGNWTILRPCITYSSNRFQLGTLEANTICLRGLQGLPVIMAREILQRTTTMTWAGDVAKLVARLVLNDHARGDDFNVVTAEHQSWKTVADVYRESIGLKVLETDVDTYRRVVGGPYQIRYDRLLDRRLDNSKVLAATGISAAALMPLRNGLPLELEKFRSQPRYGYIDFPLHGRMDRVLGTKLPLEGYSTTDRQAYNAERYPRWFRIRRMASKIRRKIGI